MSTILKALRRLEEQKASGAERPLREEIVLSPRRTRGRSGAWRAVVAGVVVASAGAALVWSLRSSQPTPAPPPPAQATLPEVAAPPPPAAPPAIEPVPDTRTVTVAAPAPPAPGAVVPVPASPEEFGIVRPNATVPAAPLSPTPLPTIEREEILAADPPPPRPTGRSNVRPPPPIEDSEEPLEPPPQPHGRAAGLASEARAEAPIHVARTLWHPEPGRRLAWVEIEGQTALREVREGEQVGRYVVEEISPTAVLFRNGDSEVRREVGP